jgi:hypothetical protein
MIKCEHARLIDHVLRQRRRRDNRRQNRNRDKKFQFDHWSPPAIDPVHSCGSSEAKTDVCASAFPARAEMPITVRRSGFYEAARAATHLMKKVSGVIAGLDPAIHLLAKVDGYAGQSPRMTTLRV